MYSSEVRTSNGDTIGHVYSNEFRDKGGNTLLRW